LQLDSLPIYPQGIGDRSGFDPTLGQLRRTRIAKNFFDKLSLGDSHLSNEEIDLKLAAPGDADIHGHVPIRLNALAGQLDRIEGAVAEISRLMKKGGDNRSPGIGAYARQLDRG